MNIGGLSIRWARAGSGGKEVTVLIINKHYWWKEMIKVTVMLKTEGFIKEIISETTYMLARIALCHFSKTTRC